MTATTLRFGAIALCSAACLTACSSTAKTETWPGAVTGSDQMRIGTASAYRDELAVTCSGSRETPTATIRTTDGWTAVTTAPAGGFGASDMKVTSPEGEEASFPASATQGPVWKDKSFASIFGRHMTVDSQEWRLYLQDVSCA